MVILNEELIDVLNALYFDHRRIINESNCEIH